MANEEHLEILKKGIAVWNQWRKENRKIKPDLVFANLKAANLSGANFREANLSSANLNKADLSKANLYWTNLGGANLREANFSGANLVFANLHRTNLSGAIFDGSSLLETIFANTNLNDAKGLDRCHHLGRSIIDHYTLQQSGHLPEGFLRGCGLTDDLIDMFSKLKKPQYYSCFISFSYADKEFVNRLYNDLQSHGIRCWYAAHDMQPGKKIHEQIDEAIKTNDRVLLVLSKNSMNSEWVKTEIANARAREVKEGRAILLPVSLVEFEEIKKWECFDADIGKDSAREIREYFIPNWSKPNEYYKGFKKMVQALKISQSEPPKS